MRTIATVNTQLPTVADDIQYISDRSLIDFDVIFFDPRIPLQERIEFSAGGSAVAVGSGKKLIQAVHHWKKELGNALEAGKTVFFLMDSIMTDDVAVSSSSPRKNEHLYNSIKICNFDVLPITVKGRNAKGARCKTIDGRFRGLLSAIEGSLEYRVLIDSPIVQKVFVTRDGKSTIGAVVTIENQPGNLVLIPYFDVPDDADMKEGEWHWSADALASSHAIVQQLLEIDRSLRLETEATPQPAWLADVSLPQPIVRLDAEVESIDLKVAKLKERKREIIAQRSELSEYLALLYENGIALESAITKSLQLLGYHVENFRDGDLEIDHIIVGPSGLRMIGEAEGKDSSAIGITKFRQLESNILEDFERDTVSEPAKAILFGNGYRLSPPPERKSEFTEKCVKNSIRSGAILVRTADLYQVVLHLLDNPKDEDFRERSRAAIEQAVGSVVQFPTST